MLKYYIVSSSTDLIRKDVDWHWRPTHEKAFQDLKHIWLKSVVLTFSDLKTSYMHTNANAVASGATLSQENKQGKLRPIACASRKLSHTENNYPAHEKECLSVVDTL